MQPFERLRYLARWSEDDGPELLSEAADCLAAFGGDPAGLVVACRRLARPPLVVGHRCGGSARRCSPRPTRWTRRGRAWQAYCDDATPGRLAAALPFPHDDPVAVLGWPEVVATALGERPDLDVVAVRSRTGCGQAVAPAAASTEQPVRVVAEPELLAIEPSHLLIEAGAAGGGHALVPPGALDLAAAARSHGAQGLAGRGHRPGAARASLPVAAARPSATRTATGSCCAAEQVDRVVGPTGLEPPASLTRRMDCTVAPGAAAARGVIRGSALPPRYGRRVSWMPTPRRPALPRCPDLSTVCLQCGTLMREEHAHYRCPACGWRDSCCDGPY